MATKDYDKLIEYRYLNMDSKQFFSSQEELKKSLSADAFYKAIPNFQYNQCLIVGSNDFFHEVEAIHLCRELSAGWQLPQLK